MKWGTQVLPVSLSGVFYLLPMPCIPSPIFIMSMLYWKCQTHATFKTLFSKCNYGKYWLNSFILTVGAICRFIMEHSQARYIFPKCENMKVVISFLGCLPKPSTDQVQGGKTHMRNQNLTFKSEIQSLWIHNYQKVMEEKQTSWYMTL